MFKIRYTASWEQRVARATSQRWSERWGARAAERRAANCPWPNPEPDKE
jgi:hypothetical protein